MWAVSGSQKHPRLNQIQITMDAQASNDNNVSAAPITNYVRNNLSFLMALDMDIHNAQHS